MGAPKRIDLDDLALLAKTYLHMQDTNEQRVANALLVLLPLAKEVLVLATTAMLPDGDKCDVPTALWAESWAEKLSRPRD